jgi:hypothetical protein
MIVRLDDHLNTTIAYVAPVAMAIRRLGWEIIVGICQHQLHVLARDAAYRHLPQRVVGERRHRRTLPPLRRGLLRHQQVQRSTRLVAVPMDHELV